jgi:hypothetical protein
VLNNVFAGNSADGLIIQGHQNLVQELFRSRRQFLETKKRRLKFASSIPLLKMSSDISPITQIQIIVAEIVVLPQPTPNRTPSVSIRRGASSFLELPIAPETRSAETSSAPTQAWGSISTTTALHCPYRERWVPTT